MTVERSLAEILTAREHYGTDCSEDESARLKVVVRRNPEAFTARRIGRLFPVEYGEACRDLEEEQ